MYGKYLMQSGVIAAIPKVTIKNSDHTNTAPSDIYLPKILDRNGKGNACKHNITIEYLPIYEITGIFFKILAYNKTTNVPKTPNT